jgi:hypothetical protein
VEETMQHRWSNMMGGPAAPEMAGPPQPGATAGVRKSPKLSDPRSWEPCARTQIINHPRVALALALAAGLMVGFWVKR